VWQDKTGSDDQPVNFKGNSLVLIRIEFINCGHWDASGSLVMAAAFTGKVLLDHIRTFHCTGAEGLVSFENTEERVASVNNSLFDETYVHYRGAVSTDPQSTGDDQKLTLIVANTTFLSASCNDGYGTAVCSMSINTFIEDCVVKNHTVATSAGQRGLFVRHEPKLAMPAVLTIVRCTVDNGQTNSRNSNVIYFNSRSATQGTVSMTDFTLLWKQGTAQDSPPIRIDNAVTLTMTGCNVTFGMQSGSETGTVWLSVMVLKASDCYFETLDPQNQPRNQIELHGGDHTIENCYFTRGRIGIKFDSGTNKMDLTNCSFVDMMLHGIWGRNDIACTLTLERCLFGEFEEESGTSDPFVRVLEGAISFDYCCFIPRTASKVAIDGTSGRTCTLFSQNCFFSYNSIGAAISQWTINYETPGCGPNYIVRCTRCQNYCPSSSYGFSLMSE
jgi:predicted RNA-binding Zn-ribbon protein involved in translation (DUF1610 family)